MVGYLWPCNRTRSPEPSTALASSQPGSIEISSLSSTSSFWPGTPRPGSIKVPKKNGTPGKRRQGRSEIEPADPVVDEGTGGVRQQVAFLEAVVKSTTPTLLLCSPRVVTAEKLAKEEEGEDEGAGGSSDAELNSVASCEDYDEVQLVLRIPKQREAAVQSANDSCDSGDAAKQAKDERAIIDDLRKELQLRDKQRQRMAAALETKNQECDNLTRVVRELTESRNKLANFRATHAERMADMQHEYMRVMRIADLSRTVSKENLVKTQQATHRLNQVEEELARQKLLTQQGKDRYMRLKLENLELREKLCLLERMDMFKYHAESACMLEFKHYHLKETY